MTVWLHVTKSYFWSRPPVGSIRVERELFAALATQLDEPPRYCVFVGGEICEVDPAAKFLESELPVQASNPTLLSALRGAAWEGGKAAFYHLMRSRPRAEPALHRILEWRQKLKHWRPSHLTLPPADIRPGDTFLTVSDDSDYNMMFAKVIDDRGAKLIGFCHDVLPVLFPHFFDHGSKGRSLSYLRTLVSSSAVLLCNSECTRADVAKFAEDQGLEAPPIVVVPLGCSLPAVANLTPQEAAQVPDGDYILFVSTIERRKNHRILYEVYAEMADHPDFEKLPIICMVGMPGWRVKDLLGDIELNDRIAHKFLLLNNVSDAMLAALYRDALFCVYPSYYEGWGLPVSEALAFGKAVIASNAGALPEAGAGCALHLSPYDTRAWREAICRMAFDHGWRREWELRVKRSFRYHDWDQAAAIVLEAIDLNAVHRSAAVRPVPVLVAQD